MLTLGSLFDGIGGWPDAAIRAGVKPLWASEIEPFPAAVTAHHYPGMTQLGDITKINVDELEPVDIICAGSPCQDLSVAGKRKGLAGERSGLFRTAIDIVHRLRERTGKPRFFVWENVLGAFSSNGGADFRAVLEEIGQTEIPMPERNKWAQSGMVQCDQCEIAWRVLDAQYWGVPQRRKRIFLVADFAAADRRAAEILFVEQGLHGNFAESEGEGQESAGGTGKSVDSASGTLTPWDVQSNRIQSINGTAAALYGGAGQGTHNWAVFDTRQVAYSFDSKASNSMKSANPYSGCRQVEIAKCLDTTVPNPSKNQGGIAVMCKPKEVEYAITAKHYKNRNAALRDRERINVMRERTAVVRMRSGKEGGGKGALVSYDKSLTLATSNDQTLITCYNVSQPSNNFEPYTEGGGKTPTLTARMGTGGNQVPIVHCLNDQGGKAMNVSAEKTGTLRAEAHGHAPIVHSYCIAGNTIDRQPKNGGNGTGNQEELSYTLNTVDRHAVSYSMGHDERSAQFTPNKTGPLTASDYKQPPIVGALCARDYKGVGNQFVDEGKIVVGSLCAHDGRGFNGQDVEQNKVVYPACKVRRLTPIECERLQGWPDGYTDITLNGKPASDANRYKALGNGMAQPCARFVIRRIAEVVNGKNEGHD